MSPIAPAPAVRRRVPRAVREREMLEVAERVFAERGYHAASVDAIAEGTGITKPMVYAYFGSKEGLYLACMERARRRLFEAIDEAADADAPPDEQLWFGVLAFFTFVAEQRESWSVLFGEATGRDGPFAAEATRLRGQLARLVAQLLGEAAAAEGLDPPRVGVTDPLAHALVGAAESLAGWWLHQRPDEPTERVALWLMNFAWTGFGDLVRGEEWTPPAP
jgi:AcrR family transcriptional regulator